MAVTPIPNVTNWTVTPKNGQAGYFNLMNTWLSQSTSVIASLQTAITAQNIANSEINNLAIQTENNAIVATSLANFRGTWSNSITYSKGQSVSVSGLYYTSKVDSNLNHVVTDTNYWLANPINTKAETNQTFYIGTTAVAINRTTGAITLTGTNIDGNAGTATLLQNARTINGVNFNGSANISVGLNNQSGLITSSLALDNTHKNKVLVCSGTFAINLPTSASGATKSGDLFIISNVGTGTISLGQNGNSWDLNRATILAGETLIIQSDVSFYRFVSRSKDFPSNINTAAGYTYLPNGVIMQWGRSSTNIAPNGTLNITFPITFPTDIFYSDVAVISASTNNQLVIPFVGANTLSNLAVTNNDGDSTIAQIRWFSIGY